MKPAKTTEEELRTLRKSIISLVKSGKIKVLREDKRELNSQINRMGKSVVVTILPWLQQNVRCPNCGGSVHYDNHLYPVCDKCSLVLETSEPVTIEINGEKISYQRFPN
jgi:tRNA(Ile2) C34 agmatinyltransferase TiaS